MPPEASDLRELQPGLLAELADQSGDGLLAFDRELRCTYGNRSVQRLTGLPPGDWVGRTADDCFPFLDPAELRQALAGQRIDAPNRSDTGLRVGSGAGSSERGWFVRPGTSDRCFFEAEYFPLHAPDGQVAGVGVVMRDITDHRRLEADLRDAVQMRDQFLSVASHELGTPLTSLRLLVDTLMRALRRQTGDDQGTQLLEKRVSAIGDQVMRLAGLVETLLDVSRIAQGRLSLSPEPVDLSVLVRRVVNRMSPLASDAGCSVALELPGPVEGVWDRGRIEQMVSNLLSNAFKYGAGKPVDVEVAASNAAARVRVVDRGIGIPADQQRLIFERFARAAPQNQYGGFGLGLWITRRTLEEMGGAIRVESQEGAGARFEIELPRRQMNG